MKRNSLSTLLLLVALTANAQTYRYTGPSGDEQIVDISVVGVSPPANYYQPIDATQKKQTWPEGLHLRLDSLLTDSMLESTQLALVVYDLTDDKPLYQYNERQMMRPASTMKLLTSITALDKLGSSHCYHTTLHLDGSISDNILTGDIYCVGSLDPMTDSNDMLALAQAIASKGVKRIQGRIITDKSMKDPEEEYGEGWCWDDDNPILSPLLVGRKDAFASELLKALRKAKIDVSATTHDGKLPQGDITVLCSIERPIADVMMDMMKKSDNLYAESMFYQLAAYERQRFTQEKTSEGKGNAQTQASEKQSPARANDAATIIGSLIDSIMPYPATYRIADGSGLSLYNYITADIEAQMLRYAYRNTNIFSTLISTLPIAGVDGTLKQRLTSGAPQGNVRAKTGTLTGIYSLAGYCTASNGHALCFAIINQGVMNGQQARTFQDKVCHIMCDKYVYLPR